MDHAILTQVLALEVYYCVKVTWTRDDAENGREEYSTAQLGQILNDRMRRARLNRDIPRHRRRWKRAS